MVAVYKPNVSISMAWGLVVNSDFVEHWANDFSDSKASSRSVDIFYNNSLVYRGIYVEVDGGRSKLPLPANANDLTVPEKYYRFIKLLDELESHYPRCEEYFKRANLQISDMEWPEW